MGYSKQEYWSGLPCPPARDLPDPGIKPLSLALADGFFTAGAPWEAPGALTSDQLNQNPYWQEKRALLQEETSCGNQHSKWPVIRISCTICRTPWGENHVGLLIQKLLRISGWPEQSINLSTAPIWERSPERLHTGHTRVKHAVLVEWPTTGLPVLGDSHCLNQEVS